MRFLLFMLTSLLIISCNKNISTATESITKQEKENPKINKSIYGEWVLDKSSLFDGYDGTNNDSPDLIVIINKNKKTLTTIDDGNKTVMDFEFFEDKNIMITYLNGVKQNEHLVKSVDNNTLNVTLNYDTSDNQMDLVFIRTK